MTTQAKTTKGIVVAIREHKSTGAAAITLQFTAATKKIARTTGSFVDDGFTVGSRIYTDQADNLGPFTIAAVSALEITVEEAVVDAGGSPAITGKVFQDLDIGEVFTHDGPGGSAEIIDASHYGSTAREKLLGIPDEGQFTIEMNRIAGDAGQKQLRTNRKAQTLTKFRVIFDETAGANDEARFEAYVLNFSTSGSVDERQTASVALEISGLVTWTKDEE